MSREVRDEIRRSGYIFLKSHRPNESVVELAKYWGKPIAPWEDGLVQALVPRSEAAPNSYSGIYGLGHFPFHSDLAHWRTPPRYLLLRCVTGYADWNAPTEVVHQLGYDYPVFRRTKQWL
ncbi:hypothetical protein ACEN2J_20760, partial [Pseudorhodobacter sp. W20_MBD10_FR17]|uniref:hypothetical protein n=1 Tax=Pseudorhodobacter sp. W20_MBD10_FR17 TaxID=3240266 RepID=UPI003F9CE77A